MKRVANELRTWRSVGVVIVGFLALAASQTVAKSAMLDQSPTAVVREYCELDMKGARLSSQNPYVDKIFALVSWPDEPGWDSAIVVKKFAIVSARLGHQTPTVTVRYNVFGKMTGTHVAPLNKREEFVTFSLSRSGSGWKIERPLIPPHVSVEAATTALGDLLKDERNAERRKRIEAELTILRQWGGRPSQ